MSYAFVPRRPSLRGYAGYNDLPGADPNAYLSTMKQQAQASATTLADAAKDTAIQYAEQQIANYPPASELLDEYNTYKGYLKGIPDFDVDKFLHDPKMAEQWMKQALTSYLQTQGIPIGSSSAQAYIASVASGVLGVPIPSDWPTNMKDLKKTAVTMACTAVAMYTGVDPKTISVTADALADGKLSPEECQSIGGMAGAAAGATAAQAFGIPAPIGAAIGNLVGRDIGGTLGQIFGAGKSGTQEMDDRIAALRSSANKTIAQANQICDDARSAYWKTFDALLLAMELQWQTLEVNLANPQNAPPDPPGWKFALRWYGTESYTNLGQPFSHAWNPTTQRFDGAEIASNRAVRIKTDVDVVVDDQGKQHQYYDYTYGCPFDFGCPYPPLPPDVAHPVGFERDVAAFLARGALWVIPSKRNYTCSYQLPPSGAVELMDTATYEAWHQSITSDLQREQAALQALKTISVAVIGDLIKTGASVAAEKTLNEMLRADQATIIARALARSKALTQAKATGKNLSDLLNYGMLALGAGLLASVFMKRRSS